MDSLGIAVVGELGDLLNYRNGRRARKPGEKGSDQRDKSCRDGKPEAPGAGRGIDSLVRSHRAARVAEGFRWNDGAEGLRRNRSRCAEVGVPLQPLQIRPHVGGVLVAQVAILFQCLIDDIFQARGQLWILLRQRHRRSIQNCVEDQSLGFAAEGQDAGDHLVEHHAEREQIAACIHFLAPHLFRRHVSDVPRVNPGVVRCVSPIAGPRRRGPRQEPPWRCRSQEPSRARGS